MENKIKHWVIYNENGNKIGTLMEDLADDAKDAVLNWADEYLIAELIEVNQEANR